MFKEIYLIQLKIKKFFRLKSLDSAFNYIKLAIAAALFVLAIDKALVGYGLVINADNFKNNGNYYYAKMLYSMAEPYYSFFAVNNEYVKKYSELIGKSAFCDLRMGRSGKAETSIAYGLMNIESHFGRGSYESADYMRNYIIPYYLEKGDAVYVQKFANYALNIYKNSSDYLNQVADILRLYGRSEILFKKEYRGYELYTTALTVLTSAPKPDFVIYINVVDDIAQYYKTQSKTDLIIELYADAIKEIEAKDPSAGAPLAAAYRNLGKAYCENEEYAKAPKFYEKSIAIIKTLPRGDTLRKQIAPIMYELADIYEKANLYADSKKMKQEAYRYQAKSFLSFI